MKVTLATLCMLLSLAASAAAATIVVDNTVDPGDGVCGSPGCTLREAITAADGNPGADIINFNIPGAGVHTITPTSPLPTISEAVTIDGYTQPGTSENTLAIGDNAVLLIELNGTSAGAIPIGLNLTANDCVIRGLVINRWSSAININSNGNLIEGNFVGTDAAGTSDLGNTFRGVSITSGDANTVGGQLPGARNLISGNDGAGVTIFCCAAADNLIQGNYIGTDRSGTMALPNEDGIIISGDSLFNLVGGTETGAGNLISGNSLSGVHLTSTGFNNMVQGNYIGTDATGTIALGNETNGVTISRNASAPLVGGMTPGAGNLISGNLLNGIAIGDGFLTGTPEAAVQGNFIGITATGMAPLENEENGILIDRSDNNLIGGTEPTARNIISVNRSGVLIRGGAMGNVVQGNYIGTDVTGLVNVGSDDLEGVKIEDSPNNLIGGSVTGAGNLISANLYNIYISGTASTANLIQGNLIGADATGGAGFDVGGSAGILLVGGSGTIIGGPAGTGNVITFNGGNGGIAITSASTSNNIFGNSIFGNDGIGINLVGGTEDANGVTANDFPDSDIGANNLQNYPVISEIAASGSDRSVEGSLTSNPNTDYVLNFYSNAEVDPSGYGEGETWLGSLDVHTNAQSTVDFSFVLDAGSLGRFITATATDPNGNTSEFSMASDIVPPLSRFLNISTRLRVQTGDNVLIGGFIITGNDPKQVILRAIGPSLGGQGVQGFLANPTLELHHSDGTVVTNDDWRDTQEAEIIATGIPPTNNKESAIVATLDPGSYTAIVRGSNGGSGVGLVEAYDLAQAADSDLANISTRGFVETGDNVMIGGIIIGPDEAADGSILIRALGPSLTDLGVPNALADPMLELRGANGTLISSNNDWKSTQQAAIEATGIPPSDDNESAILATLASGNYTAIVFGSGGVTGVSLVEAYHLD